MPVVKIDDHPDKEGRKARRLLFLCYCCRYIGTVAVRRDLYKSVCQECGSGDWVSIQGDIQVIQRPPPKKPSDV